MSDANRMVPGPWRGIGLPDKEEVKTDLLNTRVKPENALSLSEFKVMKFIQEIQTKFSEILERKAGLLTELRKFLNQERIDCEELVRTLERNYFKIIGEAINDLVSEIEKNEQILGLEAAKEFIEKIQNSLYLDPEKDGDLINKLEAELAKLIQNSYQLEEPLNLVPRYQLALISDGGKKLEQFRRRVKEALERKDDKEQLEDLVNELKGLVEEISALKIMLVFPSPSSRVLSERKAYELKAEYDQLRRSANYQAILISEGGKKLEQFKERVQAALKRNNYRELKDLVNEISALKIMLVFPSPSSRVLSEREACELKAEYDQLRRSANYQAILISEGGNKLKDFEKRVQEALRSNDEKKLEDLVKEISALEIMLVFPSPSSRVLSEREACELKAKYQSMIEEVQRRLRKLRSST